MKYLILLILAILVPVSELTAQKIGADEYQFIANTFGGSAKSRTVLIEETLAPKLLEKEKPGIYNDTWKEELSEALPALGEDTRADFFIKNDRPYKWSDGEKRFNLVNRNRLEKIFARGLESGDPWIEFFKEFPSSRGYYEISRAGFNKTGDQALIFQIWRCGGTCGEASYVLYVKVRGHWEEKGKLTKYVS